MGYKRLIDTQSVLVQIGFALICLARVSGIKTAAAFLDGLESILFNGEHPYACEFSAPMTTESMRPA